MIARFMIPGLATLSIVACREAPSVVEQREEVPWVEMTGSWRGNGGGMIEETEEGLQLDWDEQLTAAVWDGDSPTGGFEFECQAMRVDGVDFFFSLTFPIPDRDQSASWVAGGWGGSVVGISSVDDMDASENETTTLQSFEKGRWYEFRLKATNERLQAWVDGEMVVDLEIEGRKLSLRPGPIERCLPFGVATWQTTGLARGMRWRPLE